MTRNYLCDMAWANNYVLWCAILFTFHLNLFVSLHLCCSACLVHKINCFIRKLAA